MAKTRLGNKAFYFVFIGKLPGGSIQVFSFDLITTNIKRKNLFFRSPAEIKTYIAEIRMRGRGIVVSPTLQEICGFDSHLLLPILPLTS